MVEQQQQDPDNDKEWILEIMTEFLQSPLWKNPIISFVEEHCIVFENTEENRLDYTEVHTKFKRLVESKLEAYIQDLGISQSDFVMAQQRAHKRIHKSLLQQILAVEDFVLFKQMMVNKNIQMNKEAMKQMQKKGAGTNRISDAVAQVSESESEESEEDEEEMMRKAIAESTKMAELEEARRKKADEAALAEALRVQQAEEEAKRQEEAKAQAQALVEAEASASAAAQAQAESQARAKAAFSRSGMPALGASGLPAIGSALPGIGGHKPKSTGLALFDEIEINDNDAAEVQEEKSQRQALKQAKTEMIQERNQKRQAETEAAQKAREAAQETEDQEAKAARIQRGLQALSLAPNEASVADKRTNMYKNIRKDIV